MAASSQNCTQTLDTCFRSGFSIEHQCRRGLWLSSDQPLHHASAAGSLPFCLAQTSCMLPRSSAH